MHQRFKQLLEPVWSFMSRNKKCKVTKLQLAGKSPRTHQLLTFTHPHVTVSHTHTHTLYCIVSELGVCVCTSCWQCDLGEHCAVRKGSRIGKMCDCPQGAFCNFFLLKCLWANQITQQESILTCIFSTYINKCINIDGCKVVQMFVSCVVLKMLHDDSSSFHCFRLKLSVTNTPAGQWTQFMKVNAQNI